MGYNFVGEAASITVREACKYDSNVAFQTNFNINGEFDDWTYHSGIHTYGCWNGYLFATLFSDVAIIGRTTVFPAVPAEDYYILKIAMKYCPTEREADHQLPTTGKIRWKTLSDSLWSSSKEKEFTIYPDNAWHVYVLNMGDEQWWQGDVNMLRFWPTIDGADNDEFFIKYIKINSIDTFNCFNNQCTYFTSGNYSHPCEGVGLRGSCTSSRINNDGYTITENINDEFIVNINGYGNETITIRPVNSATGDEVAKSLMDSISKTDIGGYAETAVEYTNYGEFKIYSGTHADDSFVLVVNNPLARTLGFFSESGSNLSEYTTGEFPVDGFKPLSSFKLKSFQLLDLFDNSKDTSLIFNPLLYNVEGGRSDWNHAGVGGVQAEAGYSETYSDLDTTSRGATTINNGGKTIIDLTHPFNASGRIKKIYACCTLDDYMGTGDTRDDGDRVELTGCKIVILRPMKNGYLRFIDSVDINNRDRSSGQLYSRTQESIELDCDLWVNRGDLIGLYNAKIYAGASVAGQIDSTYYHVVGLPTGVFNPGDVQGDGNAGLLLYARSDEVQGKVVIDIDLQNRVNIEDIVINANVDEGSMEYNIARCLDINWEMDFFGEKHETGYESIADPGLYTLRRPNQEFGLECLTDGILTVPDGLAGTSFDLGQDEVSGSGNTEDPAGPGCHPNDPRYFFVNGDAEWMCVYQHLVWYMNHQFNCCFDEDPISFSITFPYGRAKTINRSVIYFKEKYNFRSFSISTYLGPDIYTGDSDNQHYDYIDYTSVIMDGVTYEPGSDYDTYLFANPSLGEPIMVQTGGPGLIAGTGIGIPGSFDFIRTAVVENPDQVNVARNIDWSTMEHTWEPKSCLGYRFLVLHHKSTKLCEFELYASVSDTSSSLVGSIEMQRSHYGDNWWPLELTENSITNELSAYVGDTPRHFIIEIEPITTMEMFDVIFNVKNEDVYMGEKGCEYNVHLDASKTGEVNPSKMISIENVYGTPATLFVDIPLDEQSEKGLVFFSTMGDNDSIINPDVGVDARYKIRPDYPLVNNGVSNCATNCDCYGLKNLIDGKMAYYSKNDGYSWHYYGILSHNETIEFQNIQGGTITVLNLPVLTRVKYWKFCFLATSQYINIREVKVYYQGVERPCNFYSDTGLPIGDGPISNTAPHIDNLSPTGSYYRMYGTGNTRHLGIELLEGDVEIDKIVFYNDVKAEYSNSVNTAGVDIYTGLYVRSDPAPCSTDIYDYSYCERATTYIGPGVCSDMSTDVKYPTEFLYEDWGYCQGALIMVDKTQGGTYKGGGQRVYDTVRCFDDIDSTHGGNAGGNWGITGPHFIGYQLTEPMVITQLTIRHYNGCGCSTFEFQGTNDTNSDWDTRSWDVLYSYPYNTAGSGKQTWEIPNSTAYRSYRVRTPNGYGEGRRHWRVAEMEYNREELWYGNDEWVRWNRSGYSTFDCTTGSGACVSGTLVSGTCSEGPMVSGTCTSGIWYHPSCVSGTWEYEGYIDFHLNCSKFALYTWDIPIGDSFYTGISADDQFEGDFLDEEWSFEHRFKIEIEEYGPGTPVGFCVGPFNEHLTGGTWYGSYLTYNYRMGPTVYFGTDYFSLMVAPTFFGPGDYTQYTDRTNSSSLPIGTYYVEFTCDGASNYEVTVWTDDFNGSVLVKNLTLTSTYGWDTDRVGGIMSSLGSGSTSYVNGKLYNMTFNFWKNIDRSKFNASSIKFPGTSAGYVEFDRRHNPSLHPDVTIAKATNDFTDTDAWTTISDQHGILTVSPDKLTFGATSSPGSDSVTFRSNYYYVGDFDIQLDFNIIQESVPTSGVHGFYINVYDAFGSGASLIIRYYRHPSYKYYTTNGNDSSSGDAIYLGTYQSHTSGGLRIRVQGGQAFTYYKTNDQWAWQSYTDGYRVSTGYNWSAARVQIVFQIGNPVGTPFIAEIDNFTVTADKITTYTGDMMPSNTYSMNNKAFFIDFWVQFNSLPANNGDYCVFVKSWDGDDITTATSDKSWAYILKNENGTHKLQLLVAGTTVSIPTNTTWAPEIGKWYNIVFDPTRNHNPITQNIITGTFLDGYMSELRVSSGHRYPDPNADRNQIEYTKSRRYERHFTISSYLSGDNNSYHHHTDIDLKFKNSYSYYYEDNTWCDEYYTTFAIDLEKRQNLYLLRSYGATDAFDFTLSSNTVYSNSDTLDASAVVWDGDYTDARWLGIRMLNGDGTDRDLRKIGIYPSIQDPIVPPGGDYNTEWESLGSSITSYDLGENLALGCTVSGSSEADGMFLGRITDGSVAWGFDKVWGSEYSSSQWMSVDLGIVSNIYKVKLYHGVLENDTTYLITGYTIEYSLDGTNYTNMFTITGNTSFEREHELTEGVDARHVRITVTSRNTKSTYLQGLNGKFLFKGSVFRELEVYAYYGFTINSSEDYPIIALNLRDQFYVINQRAIGIDVEDDSTDWSSAYSDFCFSDNIFSDPRKIYFGEWGDISLGSSTFGPITWDDSDSLLSSTFRIIIGRDALTKDAEFIRLKFGTGTYTINACYIGYQADQGNAYDFDGDQVQVIFGSSGVGEITSSNRESNGLKFSLNSSRNLIVSIYMSGTQQELTSLPSSVYVYSIGGNDAAATVPDGVYSQSTSLYTLEEIIVLDASDNYSQWVAAKRNTATYFNDGPDYLKHLVVEAAIPPNPCDYSWWWRSRISTLSNDYAYAREYSTRALKIEYPISTTVDVVSLIEGDDFGIDSDASWRDAYAFWLYIDDVDKLDLSYGYFYFGGYDPTTQENPVSYKWNFSTLSGSLNTGWNDMFLKFKEADDIEYTYTDEEGFEDVRIVKYTTLKSMGIVYKGKGDAFTMWLDGFSLKRNVFEEDSMFGKGLYLTGDDYLTAPIAEFNPSRGAIEFWFRADYDFIGYDTYGEFYNRSLFHFTNPSNEVFGACIGPSGLEVYYGPLQALRSFRVATENFVPIDGLFHFAVVYSNTGLNISNDGSTVRMYINGGLAAKVADPWVVNDGKFFSFVLGGKSILSARLDSVSKETRSVDGVISNFKIYNYCKTVFDRTLYAATEDVVDTLIKPSELIEISKDNVTFYTVEDENLPFEFELVPPAVTIPIYVRSNIPNTLTGEELRTAALLVQWDIGV